METHYFDSSWPVTDFKFLSHPINSSDASLLLFFAEMEYLENRRATEKTERCLAIREKNVQH